MNLLRMKVIRCFMVVVLVFFVSVCMTSCTERQRKNLKHMKSDIIGLKRKIVLYDCNGKVIRQWEGRFKVETIGSYVSFIDDDGRDIKISGTVLVEEL